MRDVIIYLDYFYQGEWSDIFKHLEDKTPVDMEEVKKVVSEIDTENIITIIDSDYPDKYKVMDKPPFVVERSE